MTLGSLQADQHMREVLAQQAKEKQMERVREKQRDYLEAKIMQKEEERYQAKVAELLREPMQDTQYRRKKVEWYH